MYKAHKVGSTLLTAVSDPVCRTAQPACSAPSFEFHVEVIVE